MPSPIAHALVGVSASLPVNSSTPRERALTALVFSILASWPDIDLVGDWLGAPPLSLWAHRGAAHSLAAAAAAAWLAWWMVKSVLGRVPEGFLALALFASASHGLLDCMSSKARGVALLFPVSFSRILFPWRPFVGGVPQSLRAALAEIVLVSVSVLLFLGLKVVGSARRGYGSA